MHQEEGPSRYGTQAEADLRRDIRNCRNCALGTKSGGPVPPWFPKLWKEPRVLILGESPGREEARSLRPFVGPSGVHLRSALSQVGLDPERVGWANTVACWPCRPEVAPNADEIRACEGNLLSTLVVARARYILAVGDVASYAVGFGGLTIGERRGLWRQMGPGLDFPYVMATFHPAYVLRNSNAEKVWRQDLAEFAFYSLGVFKPKVEEEQEREIKGARVKW